MSRRRVAITGIGVVSPLGNDLDTFQRRLLEGRPAVGPITLFDPATLPTRFAAEVRWEGPVLRDRKITFALDAARQALEQAAVDGRGPPGTGGVSLGIGLELFAPEDMVRARAAGFALPPGRAERLTYLQTPSDLVVHLVARRFGLAAPPHTHVSACAAATDAIGTAFRQVASGRRDFALAGGTDSMIHPLGLGGFCKLGALSTRGAEPARASRPFDRDREGFVLGEGAAVLVLEPLDGARARGAAVLGEVLGYGASFDAHGISEPHPDGRGARQAMERALRDAGLGPEAVEAVSAHGTGTPKNDPVEAAALEALLGARVREVPIVATKSLLGHLIAAAGAIEVAAALACTRAGALHATANLDEVDPRCAALDHVRGAPRPARPRVFLKNSFGFGGQNASLVLGMAQ